MLSSLRSPGLKGGPSEQLSSICFSLWLRHSGMLTSYSLKLLFQMERIFTGLLLSSELE
jgi:hypothetical protein